MDKGTLPEPLPRINLSNFIIQYINCIIMCILTDKFMHKLLHHRISTSFNNNKRKVYVVSLKVCTTKNII